MSRLAVENLTALVARLTFTLVIIRTLVLLQWLILVGSETEMDW